MYLALYRAYRPEVFEEILGQDHIVKILRNQIKTDTVSHAYLFCGTRGTGKTTTARILAKAVNCNSEGERPCGRCENCAAIKDGIFIDVIEIDAASNNGVDNIRELRESVKYPPAAGSRKVYIIDEVHMLSAGAFNALLKTIEEPPGHVIFILATTEPQKLPATVLSRCLRLDFRRVPEALISGAMRKICDGKGIGISDSALGLIAANADGSVRDGLSILDQCISSGDLNVSREDVLDLIGASGEEVFLDLTDRINAGDPGGAFLILDKAMAGGKDAKQFLKGLLAHYRNLLISKYIENAEDILNLSSENAERVALQSKATPVSDINRAIVEISKTDSEAKWSTQPRILLELCIALLSDKAAASAGTPTPPAPPAGPPPPKEKAMPKGQPAPAPERENTQDDLWNSLFEGEGALKGSFTMLRSGARIKSVSDSEYIIAANSDTIKDVIDKNKKTLEELLQNRTGAGRTVKCVSKESKRGGNEDKPIEEYAAKVKDVLGLSVEIEE